MINRRVLNCAVVIGLLGAFLTGSTAASEIVVQPNSHIKVIGKSTFHDFELSTGQMVVDSVIPSNAQKTLLQKISSKDWKKFVIRIPVKTLKSHDSGLDENAYKAMHAEEFPEIIFNLKSYQVLPYDSKQKVFPVRGTGELTIANKTHMIQVNANLGVQGNQMTLKGDEPLKMSEYGIEPPSMFFGAVQTEDQVTINFNLVLKIK